MTPPAKWTVMVYMAGDNNLSLAGERDLAEMRLVGSTPHVNIVAEYDNAGAKGTRRFHIQRDGHNEHVEPLGETDSGDPATLFDFVRWATTSYPAQHYALVLWNHGGGWEPADIEEMAQRLETPNYSPSESQDRAGSSLGRTFFRSTWEEILTLPTPADRAICSDDGSGHSLDTIELGQTLQQIATHLGRPLDLLGMDACLMSSLEVAYQISPSVHYMVASQELIPEHGWPYDQLLAPLTANPDMLPADLAAHIVTAYLAAYKPRREVRIATMAALALSQMAQLTTPLDTLATTLEHSMPTAATTQIWPAQAKAKHFFGGTNWDLAHFCRELEKTTPDEPIRLAAQEIRAALKAGANRLVVAEASKGTDVAHCGGLSIYFPPPRKANISRYYADLAFAQKHRWAPMLNAYHTI